MKLPILATLMAMLTTGSVSANDVNWTGGYIGGQVGVGRALTEFHAPTWPPDGGHVNASLDGFFGGIYGGYNFELENGVVVGADIDFALSAIAGSTRDLTSNGGVAIRDHLLEGQLTRSGAARVRVGYDAGQWLPYIAGGVAVGQYDLYVGHPGNHTDADADLTFVGWTIGAGVEYAVSANVSLRTEYRYTNFGRQTGYDAFGSTSDLSSHDVRFGLSYKF
jgi:outer membrane immunogenic protein